MKKTVIVYFAPLSLVIVLSHYLKETYIRIKISIYFAFMKVKQVPKIKLIKKVKIRNAFDQSRF